MNTYEIYIDGSCLVHESKQGSYCGVILKDGNIFKIIAGSQKKTTNNRMEMFAAIASLNFMTNIKNIKKIIIYSDSRLLVNTLIKNWNRNANKDLWTKLDYIRREFNIEWKWIKGHSNTKYNNLADNICTKIYEDNIKTVIINSDKFIEKISYF